MFPYLALPIFLARFALTLCLLGSACAWAGAYTVDQVPNPRLAGGNHVADPDDILGAEARQDIDRVLAALERDTGAQVAVVAVEAIEPADIFGFAQQLFVRWGIGDKRRDDGLLVLLVKGQRTVRFHTDYGLEGALPDLLCQRIQGQFMVPEFKQGRYGAGVLAGMEEVRRILSDPSRASTLVAQNTAIAEPTSWVAFKYVVGIGGTFAILIVFLGKWMMGHFAVDKKPGTKLPRAYTKVSWLMALLGGPALIVIGCNAVLPKAPVLTCMAILYGYFMLLVVRQAWLTQRHMARLSAQKKYLFLVKRLSEHQLFWVCMAFVFPLPFLPYCLYYRSRKAHYRNHPRSCSKCHAPMRKLSEQEEDAFLSAAQQMEENLKSADHDVWRCQSCLATVLQSYPGTETQYDKCPSCKCLAYQLDSEKVLVSATYEAAGKGERQHLCHFCGHRKTTGYRIARLSDSSSGSSSSSSSGGGSSSSSWGGGSSGGGGSSSSW